MKRCDELEFLPAALEIQRTPPLPLAVGILWSIMLFFAACVVWASLGQVDIVVVAPGKIVPTGQVKSIQSGEKGVVVAIHTTEGKQVQTGDVLVELDDAKARADWQRLRTEHQHLTWNKARLQALLNLLKDDAALKRSSDLPIPASTRVRIEYDAYDSEHRALSDTLARTRAEHATLRARIEKINSTLPLLTERVDALRKLASQSLAPRAQWLELEEQRVEKSQNALVLEAELAVNMSRQSEIAHRLDNLASRVEAQWRAELADVDTQLESYVQELRKASASVQSHRIVAPIAGTVQQLAINTLGGVVTPAEILMVIVPTDTVLQVEAWVSNKDIGFVHHAQTAAIKIETFPFTQYGTLDGLVHSVSNDAIDHDDLGLVYLAQIAMEQNRLNNGDDSVDLSPGMAVTVEMNLGRRRVIEFLLAPLLRYRDEGLGER